ncbi:MAG TPA: aspartate carbamoyltransferase catalytic subunit [Wenzhouxiangellaceae bacterium]|nr:aspartate carbamoyltransferase catalytic subunit [Wenzhouxiangellaceae bacterium]
MTRHLLDIGRLDQADIATLLGRAAELAAGASCSTRAGIVANLFLEPSTRTRVSFQIAARRLGLDVVNIEQQHSSASKGESLADTARTLAAMGVGAIVLRHPEDFAAAELASALGGADVGIVNAGDGQHAHPSQALLDAATLAHAGFELAGLTLAIVGDIRHSRVARSDIALLSRLGAAEIRIAGPEEFMPDAGELSEAIRMPDIDTALDGVDAVICLRIQRERMAASGYLDGAAFHQRWGLTVERLGAMPGHARFLHPGPVNRGVEIADALVDSPRALILEQVRIGVHLRTALFEWLIDAA